MGREGEFAVPYTKSHLSEGNISILLLECYPSLGQFSGSTSKASCKEDLTDVLRKDRKQDLSGQTSKQKTLSFG